jgi:hypothetical protein
VSARDQARGVVGIERPAALAVVVRGGVGDREAANKAVSAINSQVVLGAEDADQELGLDPPRRLTFGRARAAALEDPATVSVHLRALGLDQPHTTDPGQEPRLIRHPHLSAALRSALHHICSSSATGFWRCGHRAQALAS